MKHQRGIALISVLVIASVLMILATVLIDAQTISESRTANIVNSSRSTQYMDGVEFFATNILQEYYESSEQKRVHRLQPWADGPLVFPIENNTGSLEGKIRDMHSCFNLNSIVMPARRSGSERGAGGGSTGGTDSTLTDGGQGSDGSGADDDTNDDGSKKQLAGEKLFIKLIEPLLQDLELEVSPTALASALRDWIDDDQEAASIDGAEDYYYTGLQVPYRTADTLLAHSSELTVIKGFSAAIYDKIKDFICVLPTIEGTINVNTVTPEQAELVWILLEDVELSKVQEVLEELPEDGFDQQTFFEALGSGKLSQDARGRLVFDSQFFQLKAQALVGSGRATMQSLLLKNKTEFSVVARHIGD